MSNSLDPDQARQFVGPDLGPNCLNRLSADDTSRQRVMQASLNCENHTFNPCSVLSPPVFWMSLIAKVLSP